MYQQLTWEGALGIGNGRSEAFHLGVTDSALPHVGRLHQNLPSAPSPALPVVGAGGQMSVSQQAPWTAVLGNGMELLSSAPICEGILSLHLGPSTTGELDLLPRSYDP